MGWSTIWVLDWNQLWFRLWSVRINIAGALLEGIDFGWSIYANVSPNLWVQGVSILLHVSAPIARGILQPNVRSDAAAANEKASS